MSDFFVQIGSSRDGREPYLEAARRRNLHAVLVETPEYLAFRRSAGRQSFDSCVALNAPADPNAVLETVRAIDGSPRLVLPGFERYAVCAHKVNARLGLPRTQPEFSPPDKYEQRQALTFHAPQVAQPQFIRIVGSLGPALARMSYPAVLKPVNGGGGLGVMLVHDPQQAIEAYRYGRSLQNFDSTSLDTWLLEEYVTGEESSVQGLCYEGECHILAHCTKVIAVETVASLHQITGFREVAHIATPGSHMPPALYAFVHEVVAAMGYRNGPFHIDIRHGVSGPVFVEMGFRLSGAGVTDLVRKVSGVDWGEASFSWMFGEDKAPCNCTSIPSARNPCAAHVLAFSQPQIEIARQAGSDYEVAIERFSSTSSSLGVLQSQPLSADLSRHTGPIARISITGSDYTYIHHLTEAITAFTS